MSKLELGHGTSRMPNIHPLNAPGPVFVTDDCIGCAQCYSNLPEVFAEDDCSNAYVARQPETPVLQAEVEEAIERCPVACIHFSTEAPGSRSRA